jgi:hypothetical protein
LDAAFQRDYRRLLKKYFPLRQRGVPALASALAEFIARCRACPRRAKTPARAR